MAVIDQFVHPLLNMRFYHNLHLQIYYQTLLDYNRLEKVEVLGVVGQALTTRVNMIYEEYQEAYRKFTDATMDCLSTEDRVGRIANPNKTQFRPLLI